MPDTATVQKWLNQVKVIDDEDLTNLGTNERMQLETLLGHAGMGTFLGLLLGSRQGLLVMLSHLQLGTPELDHRAAVTQGKIQGIDLIWQTLLDLTSPEKASPEGATS